jgi:HAD superfamily hydrolase (TIGR01484 family)
MRYVALATDYDGTLAHDGAVAPEVITALERLRSSGRKLIMVTGRELPDLQSVFSRLDLFDRVVVENGALLYTPSSNESRVLADRPPDKFVQALRERGVPNISTGKAIVAMWRPHEQTAIDTIRDLGLELQIIFNKDAVMILPSGVNKMTGLVAALKELKISRHGVAGIGDAENDHAFLGWCHCSIAVANAIPSLKEEADLVTRASRGDGVAELIEKLLQNDLSDLAPRLARHDILLGKAGGEDVTLSAYGTSALVCGQSGSGKSTLITGLLETLAGKGYQIGLIDPEGDYENAEQFVTTGEPKHAPSLDHLESALADPDAQVAVNLVGVPMGDRASLFGRVLALVQEHRLQTGRPHWLIIDEAHHMLPAEWAATEGDLAGDLGSLVLVTVHPEHVSPRALKNINTVIVTGKEPDALMREFCAAAGKPMPAIPSEPLQSGEAFVWFVDSTRALRVKTQPARMAHDRHKRKYAQGELPEESVFFFRGPHNQLRLRAQNLTMFLQIADGVDDATWLFHLQQGDYSKWLREEIKDPELAGAVEALEHDRSLSPAESRQLVARAIQEKYTAPE